MQQTIPPLKVMLMISSLTYGGAERQLVELFNNFDRRKIEPCICSLSGTIPLSEKLIAAGNGLDIMEKKSKYDLTTVLRTARLMRKRKIQIVHAFLFDAEMAARLAARLAGVPVVLCSERNTDYVIPPFKKFCLRITKPLVDGIIANSYAGKHFIRRELNLSSQDVVVIHNGVDTLKFTRDSALRHEFRTELGLNGDECVVGMVATFKRQKKQENLIYAAEHILQQIPNVRFVFVGSPLEDNQQGSRDYWEEVQSLVKRRALESRCLFLGSRRDMTRVYNGMELVVLPSSREGTPNVLLEAMACATPVVATDVSDNRRIVQDHHNGRLVGVDDIHGLSRAILDLLQDGPKRRAYGANARKWVETRYSIQRLARRTEEAYYKAFRSHLRRHYGIGQGSR